MSQQISSTIETSAEPASVDSSSTDVRPSPASTPFQDLDQYVALPRVGGLALSPAGDRLVVGVSTLNPKRTKYRTALWEVDPAGLRPARRLTRGAEGESLSAFLPDGSLLFSTVRKDPDAADAPDDEPAGLWLLPAGAGESRLVATRPGGFSGIAVAKAAGTVTLGSPTMPGAGTADDDKARRKARKDAAITAILHESYPVRYWDADLGPARPRLLVAAPPPDPDGDERLDLRDLTGHVGAAISSESSWDVTPDGGTIVVNWGRSEAQGMLRHILVAIDTDTGQRRTLLEAPGREFSTPVVSPDGRTAVAFEHRDPGHAEPADVRLVLVDLTGGPVRRLVPEWDRWPAGRPVWTPDGRALLLPADEQGGSPAFRIEISSGQITRLTADRASYTDLQVSPDGEWVYALRTAIDAAPAPVRFRSTGTDQRPEPLLGPAEHEQVPGRLEEVHAQALDGSPLRAWLVLPDGADADHPAPLLLWAHGGPLHSWNAWSWRWNPWLMAARGYAVLLPDPALSTGYGLEFIRRGWGRWGSECFTDLMQITDAALRRTDLDAGRTAMMGGSFGGYMANWIAGHTDRFRGIVSHASLWALDQFGPTTDAYHYWRLEVTPQMAAANSPHLAVTQIRTPMLIIHGDKDYRVPIGEALRLWAELAEQSVAEDGAIPHKFLYFPTENHWVLTPQHAKLWYTTVFAFLAHTVQGAPWELPELLR